MKTTGKLTAVLLVLVMIMSCFALNASAASGSSPLSLTVETDRDSCGEMGIITVTVTVKNNSSINIPNLVVSSQFSQGLAVYKPVNKNVVITTPGSVLPTIQRKSAPMTTCLKPGATLKYSYCVLLSCAMAKRNVSEFDYKLMTKQHQLLNTKNFRTLDIDNGYYKWDRKTLTFGDVKTTLVVAAFFGMNNATYDAIASKDAPEEKATESKTTTITSGTGIRPEFKALCDNYLKAANNYSDCLAHPEKYTISEMMTISETLSSATMAVTDYPMTLVELAYWEEINMGAINS